MDATENNFSLRVCMRKGSGSGRTGGYPNVFRRFLREFTIEMIDGGLTVTVSILKIDSGEHRYC